MKYNRIKAVDYALKWAYSRNSAYYDFSYIGGDCTNFASQSIYAGSGVMNYTPTFGWYYLSVNNRSPSWTGVNQLYNFLINNKSKGPQGQNVDIEGIEIGDIVQLSFNGNTFGHCPIIVAINSFTPDGILVCAHSDDARMRPLSSYPYKKLRFIHIYNIGV